MDRKGIVKGWILRIEYLCSTTETRKQSIHETGIHILIHLQVKLAEDFAQGKLMTEEEYLKYLETCETHH